LKYEDWEYGEVDVYCGQETATVDWQGIIEQYKEGQRDSIAEIEALNFLNGAGDFVLTAIRTDFPGLRVEDAVGNHL
jgi:hypothetical protein